MRINVLVCFRISYFLAKPSRGFQLNDEQLLQLKALVKYEYGQGKCFDEILKRFYMIYGTKAVGKWKIESWYDTLEADRRKSTIQSAQSPASAAPMSISRSIYMLASIHCLITLSKIARSFEFSGAEFASRLIDDRYLFLSLTGDSIHFYVMDTLNDDAQ